MTFLYVIYSYLIVMCAYGFLLMGMDKRRAKRRGRRVAEKRFFWIAALGGAIGVWYGMKAWRHKTQHRAFTVGIPYLVAINMIVILFMTWIWSMNAKG